MGVGQLVLGRPLTTLAVAVHRLGPLLHMNLHSLESPVLPEEVAKAFAWAWDVEEQLGYMAGFRV